MPDINHFWDRLTMEFRRSVATEKTLSLLLVQAKAGQAATQTGVDPACWGDAAKAMSKKLRPTDSIYRLSADLFGIVMPETDTENAQRVALRLQEGLQVVRAKYGGSYDINCYNYPEQVQSAHELEDIVRSLLPEEPGWDVPVPLATFNFSLAIIPCSLSRIFSAHQLSACFRSSIKSSASSTPRETRTVPGLTPARCNSSALML